MSAVLRVELDARGYDIRIGDGLLANAGEYLKPVLRRPRVIIVTDDHVAPLHLDALEASLDAHAIRHASLILPHGEGSKSFASLENLMSNLLDQKPDRNTTLIALGGGVIGDLTGFAASILLRGVDFIQIPTTLLAQVDSSVGGKTGINTKQGKNLVGSFYQPRLVLADIGALATLPRRELLAGYAEIVKYGVIDDLAFFEWLEQNGEAVVGGNAGALTYCVLESCKTKARIVAQDERESGVRALLNFGHTLGHALEAETGYSDRLLHGEAVSIGMMLALMLSVCRGRLPREDAMRVDRLLAASGLVTKPAQVAAFNARRLLEHCYQDKKATDGGLTFVLASKIGKSFVCHDVKADEIISMLAEEYQIL